MIEINEGAQALSSFGLYAICAALTCAVVYLFKVHRSLECKFRDYITTTSKELQEKTTTALNDSTNALRASTEALNRIATVMEHKHD